METWKEIRFDFDVVDKLAAELTNTARQEHHP